MFAFVMTAEIALEFYRRKALLGATTEEQCTHILFQMAKDGLIKDFESTNETKAEYVKRLSKTKRVLYLKGKDDEHEKKGKTDSGQAGTLGN